MNDLSLAPAPLGRPLLLPLFTFGSFPSHAVFPFVVCLFLRLLTNFLLQFTLLFRLRFRLRISFTSRMFFGLSARCVLPSFFLAFAPLLLPTYVAFSLLFPPSSSLFFPFFSCATMLTMWFFGLRAFFYHESSADGSKIRLSSGCWRGDDLVFCFLSLIT